VMDLVPPLDTARLILRQLRTSDVPVIHRLLDDAEIAANLLRLPHPYPREAAEELVHRSIEAAGRRDKYTWGLVVRADDSFAGAMYLRPDGDHHRAELGYWLGRPFWGQGYATEAARRLLAHGFEVLELHRIYAMCFTSNIGSARVLEKIGMLYEGTWIKDVIKADGVRDVAFYGILRDEYCRSAL